MNEFDLNNFNFGEYCYENEEQNEIDNLESDSREENVSQCDIIYNFDEEGEMGDEEDKIVNVSQDEELNELNINEIENDLKYYVGDLENQSENRFEENEINHISDKEMEFQLRDKIEDNIEKNNIESINKENIYLEEINQHFEDSLHKNRPSLCDLILENINKKHFNKFRAKSGNYANYSIQPNINNELEESQSYKNNPNQSISKNENTNEIKLNYQKHKSSGNVKHEVLSKNEDNQIDTIEENASENDSIKENPFYVNKKKVPVIVNNLQTMYDLNSERVKKRSEQMKKRKVRFEGEESPLRTLTEETETKPNKIKLNNKRFREEEIIGEEKREIKKSSDVTENNFDLKEEEEAEIVISDLECEIEDFVEDKNNLNTNNKSFIPLQNPLRSKKIVSDDKATPSYLMALYGDAEEGSKVNEINDNMTQRETNYKMNYQVSDVIEEETSENNTDSEILSRKRSSKYNSNRESYSYMSPNIKSKKNSNSNWSQSQNSLYGIGFSEGKSHSLNLTRKLEYRCNSDSKNLIKNDNYNSYQFINQKVKRVMKMHKSSKSELINFKYDINKILDNIQLKRHSEQEERLEKMKMRKKIILNKFFKSNSLHDFPSNFLMSNTFNSSISINNPKKLSIATPTFENMLKRISPVQTSRELFYAFDVIEERSKSKVDYTRIIFNEEEPNEDVIQNKSIIELKDEDEDEDEDEDNINFESESNEQLEKNEIIEDIEDLNENNESINSDVFKFDLTPIDSKFNPNEKETYKKSIFEFKDMKISQVDNFDVVNKCLESTNLNYNPNFSINFNIDKSINLNEFKSKNYLEIIKASNFQILNEKNMNTKNTFYNNNYINNNINNISISIVNNNTVKKRTKNNSITHDIRQLYKGNIKTSSLFNSNNKNDEKIRSNSMNKYSNKNQKIKNQTINNNNNTPKKNKFTLMKGDLKHYLTYSDIKKNEHLNNNTNNDINLSNLINSIRGSSDSQINQLINNSNKQIIRDAMKFIKFQNSSLDHQKFSLDRLYKSKAKYFCILIAIVNNKLEFKGLYEMNLEKNNLTKLYSVNYYPTNIDFNEVKSFYHFDQEMEVFTQIYDSKRFTPDIHAFYMQYNYKKFFKG